MPLNGKVYKLWRKKLTAQAPFLLFQVIVEQKCRTPSNAVAAPKPHVKPVGDLVLYLMIAKQR